LTHLRLVLHVVEDRQKEHCLLRGGSGTTRAAIGRTSGVGSIVLRRRHLGTLVSKWDGVIHITFRCALTLSLMNWIWLGLGAVDCKLSCRS
jgi:hypothetical protein